MKRILVLFSLIFIAGPLCAQSPWSHRVGAGVSVPYFSLDVKDDDTNSVFATEASVRYLTLHENGFCLTGAIGAGSSFSSDFVLEDGDKTAGGYGMALSLGAGYAFINTEKLTFAALGSVGLDWFRFAFKKEISAEGTSQTAEWTQTDNILAFGVGLELLAMYHLSERLSLFADCAVRYIDAGSVWIEGKKISTDYDRHSEIRSYISLHPSLGVCLKF